MQHHSYYNAQKSFYLTAQLQPVIQQVKYLTPSLVITAAYLYQEDGQFQSRWVTIFF